MKTNQNVWEKSWSTLYDRRVSLRKNINRLRVGKFFELVSKEAFVLELFCGMGETGAGLARSGYENLICSDISLNMLRENDGKINKSLCNAISLPFKDDIFDSVIIQGGLHHLRDLKERIVCLNEIKRVLKSSGLVFISEPANTVFVKVWLFFINHTSLWKLFAYSKKWHDLYMEEKNSHTDYLNRIPELVNHIKNNWEFKFHKIGLITEFFTLRKKQTRTQ
jgi:ubiquinone/menaquinone biosynthesis C-methylase UbiE